MNVLNFISSIPSEQTIPINIESNGNVCDGFTKFEWDAINILGMSIYVGYTDTLNTYHILNAKTAQISTQYKDLDIIIRYNGELIEACHILDNLQLWVKVYCNQPSEFVSMNLSQMFEINVWTKLPNETNLIPEILNVKEEFFNENDENVLKIFWKEVSGAVKYRIYFGLNVLDFEDLPYTDIFSTPQNCKVLYAINADLLSPNANYAIIIEAYNSNNILLGTSNKVIYKTCQLDCYGEPLNLFTHSLNLLESNYNAFPGSGYQIYIPVGNVNRYILKYRIQYRIKGSEEWINWEFDIPVNDIPMVLRLDDATPDSVYELRTLGLCMTGEWFAGAVIEVIVPGKPLNIEPIKVICTNACLGIDPNTIEVQFTSCCLLVEWEGVDEAKKYIIEWRRKGSLNWERGYSYETTFEIETYNNKGIESNTEYEIRIGVDCGNNISGFSLRKVVKTPTIDLPNLTPVLCLKPKFSVAKHGLNGIKITILDFENGEYTLRWKANNSAQWTYLNIYNSEYILNNLSLSLLYDISLNKKCCQYGGIYSDWTNTQITLAGGQCLAPSNTTYVIENNVLTINWVNNVSGNTNVLIQVVNQNDDIFEQIYQTTNNNYTIGLESNWVGIRYQLWINCGNINSDVLISDWITIRQNNICNAPCIQYATLIDINYGLNKTLYNFGISMVFNEFLYIYKFDLIDGNGIVIAEGNEHTAFIQNGEFFNAEGPIVPNFNNVVKNIRFTIKTKCSNSISNSVSLIFKNPYYGENGEIINCFAPTLILSLTNNNSAIYWTYQPVNGAIDYIVQYSLLGVDTWITITQNIITGVVPGNTYLVRIRSRCGQSIYSEWNTQQISIPPISNIQCLLPEYTIETFNTQVKVDFIWRIDLDTIILTLLSVDMLTIKSVSFNNATSTNYIFTNLNPDTDYFLIISGLCDNGLLKDSEPIPIKTTNEPVICPDINNFNYTITSNDINLVWTLTTPVNPDTIINYTLQWSYNNQNFEQILNSNLLTWTIFNLPRQIPIQIKLKVNCVLSQNLFKQISVTIPELICLNNDINPTTGLITNSPGGEIRLNWNNPNNLKFEIKWWLKSEPNNINTTIVTTNTLLLTGLVPNVLYDFRFIKYCDVDVTAPELPYNDVLSTPVPQTNCPYPITGLEIIDTTCSTIQVRWNKANIAISYIELRWSKLGDNEWTIIQLDKNEQYYTLENLDEDTTYVITLYSICPNLTYSLPISIEEKTKPEECVDCDSGMVVAQVKNNNIEIVWQNVGQWNKFKLQYGYNMYGNDTWITKTVIGKMYIIPNAPYFSGKTLEIKITTLGTCCDHGYNWTKTIMFHVQ